ncbi:MAG: 4Fe-4S binding protein [Promethearchaeota archaeon]|jgi:Pyruvate/2-oxoacid:ferredoxin oxidoreductase delta subunit
MSESKEKKIDPKFVRAAEIILRAKSGTKLPDEMVGIIKIAVGENNAEFLTAFEEKNSQTMEELKESLKIRGIDLSEEEILEKVDFLAKNGVMMDQPAGSGVMIYRILPYGRIFDYIFMRDVDAEDPQIKELARLQLELHEKRKMSVQKNYESFKSTIDKVIPIDRTILSSYTNQATGDEIEIIVDQTIEIPQEKILPTQSVEEIVNKYDDIAVGGCYCRNHAMVLGNPCKHTNLKESCFTFGKSARHTAKHGFARLISKEEALDILAQIRDDGLVHKVMHLRANPELREDAICNCCPDCCPQGGGFMVQPTANYTNYLARVNPELCTGCATCVENCHELIIDLNDDGVAEPDQENCIGCGVCAYFCPENAISMIKTPLRIVRIMPPHRN